jgi:hypothetical protein
MSNPDLMTREAIDDRGRILLRDITDLITGGGIRINFLTSLTVVGP